MARVDLKDVRARFTNAQQVRATKENEWKELGEFIAPGCLNFGGTYQRDEAHPWVHIIDSVATGAADSLAAGMLGGMTSPARPWFRLTTKDPNLDEAYAVKRWLDDATEELLMIFNGSNVYQVLHQLYFELAVFGTACAVVEPLADGSIHLTKLALGDFWLATDPHDNVDTLYLRYVLTAKQLIQRFGRSHVPDFVRKDVDNNHGEREYSVIQAIEPRLERDPDRVDHENMPWQSVHFLEKSQHDEPLLVEGFTHFPVLCPRWTLTAYSPYGTGIGSRALGKVKMLQGQLADLSYGIGYMARPPLMIPPTLEGREADLAPGGHVVGDRNDIITQAVQVKFDVGPLDAMIQRESRDIESMFFKDLFMMLSNSARDTRTAYEVEQLQQEKMLMLGPVLERLHIELLGPLIRNTFYHGLQGGKITAPPEGMPDVELNVDYISVLALAQKASALNGYTNFMSVLASVQQVMPTSFVTDLLDADQYVRKMADMLGVDPQHLRESREVEKIRQQRQEAQAQQMQADRMQQLAATTKDAMSGVADAGKLENFQGY